MCVKKEINRQDKLRVGLLYSLSALPIYLQTFYPGRSYFLPPIPIFTHTSAMEAQPKPTWPELLGSNNWESLLDPLNLDLRNLILRCGDFCQATYDSFNNDQNSKYCGSSRYGKHEFFNKVMLEGASNYQVSAFLYATAKVGVHEAFLLHSMSREAWDRESNWIGYIATTTDEVSRELGRREIYVVLRGTTRNYEWINVFNPKLESAESLLRPKALTEVPESDPEPVAEPILQAEDIAKEEHKNGPKFNVFSCFKGDSSESSDDEDERVPKVMHGWLNIYTSDDPNSSFTKQSARTQLQTFIKQLMDKYKDEELSITLTGHSLGASLSILASFDLAENGITHVPISAIVFGSPQVGNKAFNERLKQFPNVKILHVRNKIDLIPLYPSGVLGYVYSGTELFIDTRKCPSLKESRNPSDWHNLQAMLHAVAGWNGEEGEFELKVKRSLALVNKSSEFLKEECLVPGSWWVEKNRGMLLDENGEWGLAPPAEEDIPVPEY